MPRRILTGAGILVALMAPALAYAAYDSVALTTDVVLSVGGVTLNVSGSQANISSITVNDTDFSVTLLANSNFQVSAPGLNKLAVSTPDGMTSFTCNGSQSIVGYAPGVAETVTITPSSALCASNSGGGGSGGGGGGGGSYTTPATPATPATPTTPAVPTTPAISATPASGLSSEQITAILNVLASFDADSATIASVQAALMGTVGTATAVSAGFSRDLQTGATGNDVLTLQQYLNARGYTVSTSGAGSPGNETTLFGALTKTALIKYQKANNITPAVGYFGPKTRAAVNSGL